MTATTEPLSLTAGDTVTWARVLPEYPAPTWTLGYVLINRAAKQTFSATGSGTTHTVSLSAATTAAWTAGDYTWSAAVTSGSQRVTVGTGSLKVLPNIAALATLDTRTPAAQALDLVNDALRVYGSKAYLQGISYGDRQQSFRNPGEFMAFRSMLMAEVARERNAERARAGLAPTNILQVRLTRR